MYCSLVYPLNPPSHICDIEQVRLTVQLVMSYHIIYQSCVFKVLSLLKKDEMWFVFMWQQPVLHPSISWRNTTFYAHFRNCQCVMYMVTDTLHGLDFVWSGWQSLTQNLSFVGVFIATSSQICWHTKGEGSEKIATDAGEPMEPCRCQYGATVPGSEYSVTYVDLCFHMNCKYWRNLRLCLGNTGDCHTAC